MKEQKQYGLGMTWGRVTVPLKAYLECLSTDCCVSAADSAWNSLPFIFKKRMCCLKLGFPHDKALTPITLTYDVLHALQLSRKQWDEMTLSRCEHSKENLCMFSIQPSESAGIRWLWSKWRWRQTTISPGIHFILFGLFGSQAHICKTCCDRFNVHI